MNGIERQTAKRIQTKEEDTFLKKSLDSAVAVVPSLSLPSPFHHHQQQQQDSSLQNVDAIVTPHHHETKHIGASNHTPASTSTQHISDQSPVISIESTTMRPLRRRAVNSRRHYKSLNNHENYYDSPLKKTGLGKNPNVVVSPLRKKQEYNSNSQKINGNKHLSLKQTKTKRRSNNTTSKSYDWNTSKTPSMPNSERTIMLDHSSDGDGIELEYRDEIGFLELTHVMTVQGNGQEFRRKALIDYGHTIPVKFKVGLNINYHPVCDFYHRHRFMNLCPTLNTTRNPLDDLSSNGEKGNHHGMLSSNHHHNASKDQLEILRKYNAFVPEQELLSREMASLNRELHVIESIMESSNKSTGFYRPCTSNCCSGSYWDWEEELEINSDRSTKTGLQKLHRKGWNKRIGKENTANPNHALPKIRYLQDRRGIYFTAAFADERTRNEFGHYINGKANFNHHKTGGVSQELIHCKTEIFGLEKVGAMSTSIRSISITKNVRDQVGFFVIYDDNKMHGGNSIPQRLKARIQKESNSKLNSIRYLALGPRDSYFAELVSGETFWAIGKHDEQFSKIMQSSRVHRVAFGTFKDDSSWIVLTKDGTVAWRNIPLQLEKLLEDRESGMAAPCEVSLGDAGTFFIRFMNGEINYCLPSFADEICRRIEDVGASISYISLHPEVMDGIIIRHTELP